MTTGPEYLSENQQAWNAKAVEYVEAGRRRWGGEPSWGVWGIDDRGVGLLDDVGGLDAVELGCGTGYVSAWMARRGARPIGIDPTPNQLATARMLQREFDLAYPLVRAAAEQVPLRDGCCDLVISEYGAAIWSDPYAWIPEAARLLRPGGELIVLGNAALLMLCVPDSDDPAGTALLRPYFGMHRFDWSDEIGIEFHIGHGDWIRLLRNNGFVVEDLIELRPPEGATTRYRWITLDWARSWPCEEVWRARKA